MNGNGPTTDWIAVEDADGEPAMGSLVAAGQGRQLVAKGLAKLLRPPRL
jgi:hypothetical protein